MRIKRAPLNWIVYALSLLGLGVAGLRYATGGAAQGDVEILAVLLGLSGLLSTYAIFEDQLYRYRVALALRIFFFALIAMIVAGMREIEVLVLGGLVLEVCTYESYPLNLAVSGGVVLAGTAVRLLRLTTRMGLPLASALYGQIDYLLVAILLIVPCALVTRYREKSVAAALDVVRLDETVVKLTRLNSQYQDFATSATEIAVEDERRRITRDIHDIVGYTLTNNIAMMEAATDMMRRNPSGVSSLINAARENAEEGLDLIRNALHQLHAEEVSRVIGLRAISRLCTLFERATGTHVRLEWGNAEWQYGDAVNSVLYHLVQEALINSFRHGKAEHVTVALFEVEDAIRVSIGDDGAGAAEFQEGMGLQGMRERVEGLGGQMRVVGRSHGFSILAEMPRPVEGR